MLGDISAAGYTIAIEVISIMILVSGISLGIGYAADEKKLKEFGRSELYQSIINGVIVGSLVLAFSTGGIFSNAINGTVANVSYSPCVPPLSYNDAICFAHDYLTGLAPIGVGNVQYPSITDSVLGLLIPTSLLYSGLGILSAVSVNLGFVSFSLNNLISPAMHQLSYIISALTFALIGIQTQDALLRVVAGVATPLLLPIGVILRSFYPTRKLGGGIMAITIALFVVFPLSYLLDANITASYSQSMTPSAINSTIQSLNGAETQTFSNVSSTSSSSNSIGAELSQRFSSIINPIVSGAESLINKMTGDLAMLIVEVFFLPAFSLILTAISARELARLLGSEISFGRFNIF
jgi:hypothetical protein